MHHALLKLVRLQLKGWVRRQFTGGSLRRTVFGIVGTVLFLVWFIGAAVGASFQTARPPGEVLTVLPFYLTAFALLPLISGNDDRAIAFSPAEIDFLFAGPFSRRDLVLFKLLKIVLSSLAGGLFFAVLLHRFAGSFAMAVIGAALSMVFVNLLATAFALLHETLQERIYGAARAGAAILLIASAAGVGWFVTRSGLPMERLRLLADSTPARIALAPARVLAHLFAARSAEEFATWLAASLAMILALVALVLALDRGYMEAALAASERRQARLTRMRKGLPIGTGKPARAVRVPGLAGLGPAGAIVKKQVITAVRTSRAWLIVFALAAAYGYFVSRTIGNRSDPLAIGGVAPGLLILLTVIPQMLRFDFRGDLDSMEAIKSLPISPGAVALAELTVPSVILTLQGWVVAAAVAAFVRPPASVLLMAALAIPPLTVLVTGLENFVFLILPTRLMAHGQAGVAFSGRRILMLLARMALILLGGGAVGGVGLAVWAASASVPLTYMGCWLTLLLIGCGVVRAVAWAFARFDVSVDMPA